MQLVNHINEQLVSGSIIPREMQSRIKLIGKVEVFTDFDIFVKRVKNGDTEFCLETFKFSFEMSF